LAWRLISRPDRVRIWAAQLAANDFPPVCAMTGQPAQAWRKFRFATAPAWAYAFLVLLVTGIGLLPVFIIMAAVSRRASGHLPLTLASRGKLRLVQWTVVGLLPLTILLFVGAAIVGSSTNDQTGSTITFILILLAGLAFVAFVVGALVVRHLVGPRASVIGPPPGYHDNVVELRQVHPAFVAAVNYMHQQRAAQLAAQYAPQYPQPSSPQTPGSN
jgi:hypothetical protein